MMRVPKVSLRDASPEAFAAAARGGCFVLTDHDVPQGLMADLRREMLTDWESAPLQAIAMASGAPFFWIDSTDSRQWSLGPGLGTFWAPSAAAQVRSMLV